MGSSSTQPSSDALQPRTKAASPDIWQTSAPSPHASTVSLVSDKTCAVVTHVGLQFTWYNCNDAHIFRQQYSTVGLMLIANFWATPHFCHDTWAYCNVLLTLWFYFFPLLSLSCRDTHKCVWWQAAWSGGRATVFLWEWRVASEERGCHERGSKRGERNVGGNVQASACETLGGILWGFFHMFRACHCCKWWQVFPWHLCEGKKWFNEPDAA